MRVLEGGEEVKFSGVAGRDVGSLKNFGGSGVVGTNNGGEGREEMVWESLEGEGVGNEQVLERCTAGVDEYEVISTVVGTGWVGGSGLLAMTLKRG